MFKGCQFQLRNRHYKKPTSCTRVYSTSLYTGNCAALCLYLTECLVACPQEMSRKRRVPQVSHYNLTLIDFSSKTGTFLISTTVEKNKSCKLTYHFCWLPQKLPENPTYELYYFPPMCQFFSPFTLGAKKKSILPFP